MGGEALLRFFSPSSPASARSAPSAQRPISDHHDWQLRNNCDSQDFPYPSASQFESELFLILNSRGCATPLNPDDEPRPDFQYDFVTFDATLSQLYVPQFNLSSQDASPPGPELLEVRDAQQDQHSASVSRADSRASSSSSPASVRDSTPGSSAPTESISPGSSSALPSSPANDNRQVPQLPQQSGLRCPLCPNRAPFQLQSHLNRHAKTHSKPYACRVQPNCASRFAEQRDRNRHEARHGQQSQGTVQFFCPHNCERSLAGADGGFGVREDNAKRHIRSRHNGSTRAPIRIIT
ncbi:hypothetical protein NA56DRAFT_663615 [Hyaloscypha hepaticicola]|uniref:C2H2-type domain-containing protein n=1 Tax=Hyaloscypha hepaticicola TaxID=2082293 RepID=A0A2J6PPC4_9HELO|nr:hypothetical protein NA56DRAFT_663615 [Hyaloscypha hepaticicola]